MPICLNAFQNAEPLAVLLNCSAISPVPSGALQSLMRQQCSVSIQMRVCFHASYISARSEKGKGKEGQPGKLSHMISIL